MPNPKPYFLLLLLAFLFSCKGKQPKNPVQTKPQPVDKVADNPELTKIYSNDQDDRQTHPIDWKKVTNRDSLRRLRVHELLDSNKVHTSKDYSHAAMVFQHGTGSADYKMAMTLMKKAIDLDPAVRKWLLAAATDRYLLSIGKPQIYGTQFQKKNDGPWKLAEIDTTQVTDAERQHFGVGTLAQQRAKQKKWNSKKLNALVEKGKSVDEIIKLIRRENKATSKYDLSENGINTFAYDLMGQEKAREALKVFKLNIELYPNAYNTYDSYGECLSHLGKKDKAIAAYKKSLELNPDNENAKFSINDIKTSYKKRLPKKDTFDML